jgi:two-component system CheB/CheR fusion protein
MNKSTKAKSTPHELRSSIAEANVNSNNDIFPIVGIGASAGGLEALEQFFTNMPPNCGMAFVIIQHLDPNHKGLMHELLQHYTEMPVYTATDRLKVKPNSVYLIPPNKSLSILNGTLHLFVPIETRGLRLPVDFFLKSLADDRGEQSIGIILSGMGSDGTNGVKAIKEKAGLVLVQEPASAKFDSMPKSAIDAVMADVIAPVNELPQNLVKLVSQPVHITKKPETTKDSSALEKIIILLRTQTGNDFLHYKKSTVYRRIERRMNIHQIETIGLYVQYLQENPAEIDILFKELLIGVTNFFRDAPVWELLKDKIIPELIETLPNGQVIRAWIPGCSTGEEAYTLAIVFREAMDKVKLLKNVTLQIFATDLDSNAIDKARKGVFPINIVADVSPERLDRFFVKKGENYRINSQIRDMVIFACQNAIKDPPFTKLDLVSCRNLLIYLDADLQKKLLALFHYSLKPGALLLLGTAETNGAQTELFATVDSKMKIYQRSGLPKMDELINFPGSYFRTKPVIIENKAKVEISENIQMLADQLLLQQFSPASVLVTDKGDILYITGSTGKYLEPAAGKANFNLFAMARDGLPSAFRKAMQSHERIVLRNLKVVNDDKIQGVNVTLQQIDKPLALKGRIMVVFNDFQASVEVKGRSKISANPKTGSDQMDLELDLQRAKENLQNMQEEMQTSQEELKSANEELQSTNEELQSSNEELTTSKEEMQSLNEELHTVNAELQSKVDDYLRVNNDMTNLLNSIEIATIFLDKEFKIRQFTAPAINIFKLRQSDLGRLITDQVTDLNYPDMYNHAREVLRTLTFVETDVPTFDGRWFTIRMMPYRTAEDKIDGLVITFIDVTKSKHLESVLLESQSMLRELIQSVSGVIIGLSADGLVVEFNPGAEKLFGRTRLEVMGKSYIDLFVIESSRKKVKADMKKLLTGTFPNHYKNLVKAVNGEEFLIKWTAHKLFDDHGAFVGFINIGSHIAKAELKNKT